MTSCDVQILTPRSIRVIPAINVVRICQVYHQPFVITRHRESRLTDRPRARVLVQLPLTNVLHDIVA